MSRPVILLPARSKDYASKFVLRSGTHGSFMPMSASPGWWSGCAATSHGRTDLRLVPVFVDLPSDEQAMGASAVLGATTGSDARGDVVIYSAAAACDIRVRDPADLW
jgi:hypothetical protein